jgi:prepilin-type N-terminal cleavage/methylation domain-containing protein
MSRGRRGFTFIELLIVMIVMSLLAGLAVLKYIDLRHRAMSAQATADLEAVRLAAYSKYYETGTWPQEVGAGTTPPELLPYLPQGFSFTRSDYVMDWENFTPANGQPTGGMQIGVVLSSSNARLTRVLTQTLGNKAPFFIIGGNITFVIVGPDGRI